MNFPKISLVLLATIFLCLGIVQNLFGQYRFDSWTTDNGLPQNGLREITQTPDGYLWFTTFDGLVRFDGVRFTTFNKGNTKGITNNRFNGLYKDKFGNLWANTIEDGVLTVFRDGVFSTFNPEEVPGQSVRKIITDEAGELRFLVEDEDRIGRSWYRLVDDKFVFIEKQKIKGKIIEYKGKSGTSWTITPTETKSILNGITTVYPLVIGNKDFIVCPYEDNKGNFWIGEEALHLLKTGKITTFSEKENLPNSNYHSFWEETDGTLWFASGGLAASGVGLIEYKDGKFIQWGKDVGLSDGTIINVMKDREGTKWVATNKGLNRLRKEVIKAYSVKDGINNSEVYPIYRDSKENIWIGTTKGLNVFRNGKFENFNLKSFSGIATSEIVIQSILEDSNGTMWFGVTGGVFIYRNGKIETKVQQGGTHAYAIQPDSNGNVWVTTNKGILQFKDYQQVASFTVKDGLPSDIVTLVFEDSNKRLWFGSYGGISEFKDGKFINYSSKDGLSGNYVRTIYEDKEGTFWIGTYDEGLSRFKNGKFVTYKIENGLYNNGVFAIQDDAYGNFWISSNRGIYRVKVSELNDFADGKIAKINSVGYGREDGMLNIECNGGRQPSSIKDKDGKFWFPTQDGVVVINPDAESYKSLPPSVVIESVTVERENIDFRNGIAIEPGQRNIEIKYTGLSLIKSDQIKFKYKLEGHDEDWIDAGTRRTAYYSFLPPGNYKFHVIAATSDGTQNDNGTTIELRLKPFFYQTFWFQLACVIGAIILLLGTYKINVNRLEKREKLLTKLVLKRTEALKDANESLLLLANSDGLTSVGNRRLFEDFLSDEWNRAVRFKTEISLIILDIDHFKLFNDTYGHQAGDECLKKVAAALANTIKRPTDLVARYGGEEFAIILGGTDSAGAINIAEQALENLKNLKIPHIKSKTNEFLTISIGVATTFAKLDMTEADLINAADKALYQAKESGRNRINTFDLLNHISRNASVLEDEFVNFE